VFRSLKLKTYLRKKKKVVDYDMSHSEWLYGTFVDTDCMTCDVDNIKLTNYSGTYHEGRAWARSRKLQEILGLRQIQLWRKRKESKQLETRNQIRLTVGRGKTPR
jgi:hypothetical protein